MKNAIKFYYNLEVDSIRKLNDNYFLEVNKDNYCLYKVENDDIKNKYEIISQYSIFYVLIKNNFNDIITIINNEQYILMIIGKQDRIINLEDLYIYNNLYINIDINLVKRAKELWSSHIDYLEYQVNQIGRKYPIIKQSFSYFDGITESAIELLSTIENKRINTFIMHKRVSIKTTLFEYYNPVNIIFDTRIRDMCEFLKSKMINKSIYNDAVNYIKYLSLEEIVFFFSRLLYPSYYFDLYDLILSKGIDESSLNIIINNIDLIEEELKRIYRFIRNNYSFPEIEWLN